MSVTKFEKDPSSTLDYGIDWAPWVSSGETITVSSWSWLVGSLSTTSASISSHTAITFINSGGVAGERHTLSNRITTSRGLIDERSLDIILLER